MKLPNLSKDEFSALQTLLIYGACNDADVFVAQDQNIDRKHARKLIRKLAKKLNIKI